VCESLHVEVENKWCNSLATAKLPKSRLSVRGHLVATTAEAVKAPQRLYMRSSIYATPLVHSCDSSLVNLRGGSEIAHVAKVRHFPEDDFAGGAHGYDCPLVRTYLHSLD
jgi:hypothetical protein